MRHARSLQAKCLALPVKIRIEKFGFARFRNSGQTKNNWPNHDIINGNSGSPKLLIQANNGQKLKLVNFWNSLHSELSAHGNIMEINSYSISLYKSIYEFWRDPTPFTRTCASRMAHRLRQTSIIFRHVELLLAHRRSKWTNSEAGNSNTSTVFTMRLMYNC